MQCLYKSETVAKAGHPKALNPKHWQTLKGLCLYIHTYTFKKMRVLIRKHDEVFDEEAKKIKHDLLRDYLFLSNPVKSTEGRC